MPSASLRPVLLPAVGEECGHVQLAALRAPLIARPVPAELDAVVVGVAEVDGQRVAVVAGLPHGHAGVDQRPHRVVKRPAARVADREVVQAGRVPRRRRGAVQK